MTKIGFISDIHGNLEALQATLAKLDEIPCDQIYCLGDVVGYGANPSECIRIIQERKIITAMGNHDEYVTLLMDPKLDRLRGEVRDAVFWTQSHLPMEDLRWLSKLPMKIVTEQFTALHGSFVPVPWAYCLDENTFAANFKYQDAPLAFCGHSHSPLIGIEIPNELPYVDFIRKIEVKDSDKVMVNVGSVGQPRDHDPRSCAVVFYLETRTVELIRVEYDIAAAQAKIRASGLPDRFAARLALGR